MQHTSDFDLIRNTIARNNQYLDDRRYEDCARTFTEDGSIAGHNGRGAILEFMHSQGLGARPELQRRHVVTNIAIELSGTRLAWTATCSSMTRLAPSRGSSRRSVATPTGWLANPTAPGCSQRGSSTSWTDGIPAEGPSGSSELPSLRLGRLLGAPSSKRQRLDELPIELGPSTTPVQLIA